MFTCSKDLPEIDALLAGAGLGVEFIICGNKRDD